MFNPFTAIGHGVKYLAEHIWSGLKSVWGTKTKAIVDAAFESAKQLLESELGQFIHQVVVSLESSDLTGAARLSSATSQVQDYLQQQGKELPTVWIQWAIQTVLTFIRGLAPTAAGDPPASA